MQCWVNPGPASQTLGQCWADIVSCLVSSYAYMSPGYTTAAQFVWVSNLAYFLAINWSGRPTKGKCAYPFSWNQKVINASFEASRLTYIIPVNIKGCIFHTKIYALSYPMHCMVIMVIMMIGLCPFHSDLRDYISDTTRLFRRMHAWRLTTFISR